MTLIINPGTEPRDGHTEANAIEVAKRLCADVSPDCKFERVHFRDNADGWYGFTFFVGDGEPSVTVEIPGDEPDEVTKGTPFKSRRLYVDGSSWLYGYAVGILADRLEL